MDFIPLTRPFLSASAISAIISAVVSGDLPGNGSYSERARLELQKTTKTKHVSLTTSCSHSLELSCAMVREHSVGVGRDEVILPSFTFTSTANAVLNAGLKVVFADVEPETMNLDANDAARKINSKTAAIMPVHYAGVAADMDAFRALAGKDIFLVEDAAQGIGAYWKDKHLGSIGDMGCISFHGTKNISCGEGGAFLTANEDIAQKAEIYIEKGTNRTQFLRGIVDKYTWVSRGSSYVIAEPLAALLEANLPEADEIAAQRRRIYERYMTAFAEFANTESVRLPVIPDYAKPNGHLFYFLLPSQNERDEMMHYLHRQKICAAFHYVPLHSSPMGCALGFRPEDCPVSEELAGRLLRLPLYTQLTHEQQDYIIENVTAKLRGHADNCNFRPNKQPFQLRRLG
ncbi:MAG: dTDP-4-amino-4,6-dideoxygalactose transaminase [Bacteroidetes bacterium]|nr:dTDP-4-amino-4,6-dideoxygalactose transaminase [Bacteroidota bacterium]